MESLDVVDGSLYSLYKDVDLSVNAGYYWLITKIGDLYYASNFPTHANPRYPNIIVSDDLVTWTPWHQFSFPVSGQGVTSLFVHNNKIHGKIAGLGHFTASIPTVREVRALALDPPTENVLSENASSIETNVSGYTQYSGTPFSNTDDALHGSKSLEAASSDGTALYGPKVSGVSEGEVWYGRSWYKAPGTPEYGNYRGQWRRVSGKISEGYSYMLIDTQYWRENQYPPIIIPSGETAIAQWSTIIKYSDPTGLLADCFQVSKSPGRWQIGGTPNVGDVVQWTDTMPAEWTHYFTVFSDRIASDYVNYDGYIASWQVDSDNYLELFWNGSERELTLRRTVGGIAQEVSASQALFFHKNQPIRFAVQASNAGISLTYNLSGLTETITDTAMPGLLGGSITFFFGDHTGANLLPMWVSEEVVVNNADSLTTVAAPKVEPIAQEDTNVFQRIVEGNVEGVARIDIGAFESLPEYSSVLAHHVFYNRCVRRG